MSYKDIHRNTIIYINVHRSWRWWSNCVRQGKAEGTRLMQRQWTITTRPRLNKVFRLFDWWSIGHCDRLPRQGNWLRRLRIANDNNAHLPVTRLPKHIKKTGMQQSLYQLVDILAHLFRSHLYQYLASSLTPSSRLEGIGGEVSKLSLNLSLRL